MNQERAEDESLFKAKKLTESKNIGVKKELRKSLYSKGSKNKLKKVRDKAELKAKEKEKN